MAKSTCWNPCNTPNGPAKSAELGGIPALRRPVDVLAHTHDASIVVGDIPVGVQHFSFENVSLAGKPDAATAPFSNLSGPATGAQINGPASASESGNPIAVLNIPSTPSRTLSGTVDLSTLTATQVNAITSGNAYVYILAATKPGGEIRGQLTP